ncbi:heterogeneous nuclear ribonucleoprotein D-like [Orycteropus afer afer]|uniref:Heterogeneous nuclear ribonucleoprotein D-like n=1 Tax=Orycteropus afer afer TaxID=1230840 RepID=A0AC54ZBB2_ORYAF|nr:heterogeneous nuclear ribonucleoprotein D-like [Orycteropus afer afer]
MDAVSVAMSERDETDFPEGFRINATKYQHDASKMFIGGLSSDTSKQALLEYLSLFDEIIDITIKTNPQTGKSRGFGFVLFKDSATVEKVLQLKKHEVNGKKIQLKRAKAVQPKKSPRKVFVGGLNPLTSEEEIREYFGTFGMIEKIELPLRPRTNVRQAFGFITYTDDKPVKKLLENRYHIVGSGQCEIKIAFPDMSQKKGRRDAPFACPAGIHRRRGAFHTNRRAYRTNPDACRANPNVLRENAGVHWAVGGGGLPSEVVPVTSLAYNQLRFDQLHGNFHDVYSDQQIVNGYGENYFLGYNYGTNGFAPIFINNNMPINQVIPSYIVYH